MVNAYIFPDSYIDSRLVNLWIIQIDIPIYKPYVRMTKQSKF